MAEKYESFEKYLINHIFEQLPDITQPVYAEVSKVFYEENVGGVLYQFEFDFPSIDDMPLKKGLSGTDIPDFNKIAKDTSVKVQRVFPDGEVIVDFEFNVAGRGGDLEAYKTFSKSLAEGKGMKGVLLDYYDTFPVETTLPTTLENDITIPNTLEGTDTPTNVVDEVNKLQDNINDYLNEIILENPSRSADLAVDPLTLTLSDDGKFIDITEFVIDENYRNQGLGTEVFNRIKEFANNNNLSITTTPFVGELEDLVKKEGFVKEGNQYILKPDTPTNVVDEVSELQDTLRNKYKNELDELHIIKRPFYDPIKEINTQNGIFIEEIILKPEFRGSGIGTEIVDEIKQFATENNYGIELEPVRGENAVIRFWENQDFELQEYFDDKGNLITNDKELNNVYKWTPDTPDRPFGPGAAHIDEILNANTQLVNELPLSQTVKNQFDNFLRTRARNLTTSGAIDAVDIWELGVTGLMITAIAYKELDEIPTIFKRTATNMFNSMTAPYNIPPVPLEEYDLDYEFINKVLTTGEKVMPTDIIIKKVGDVVKGAAETGAVTGFGYVPPNLTKTDTMETTQKIQPGVQEEKMFEQAKPKKSSGGAGAKIL